MLSQAEFLNQQRIFVETFKYILKNLYSLESAGEKKQYKNYYDLNYFKNTIFFIFFYEYKIINIPKIKLVINRQYRNTDKSLRIFETFFQDIFTEIEKGIMKKYKSYNIFFKKKYKKTIYEYIGQLYLNQVERLKLLKKIKYNKPIKITVSDIEKNFAIELRDHQKKVIRYFLETDNRGLFLDHNVGSGKTLTSLAAAYVIRKKYGISIPITIITPTSVLNQFKKESEKIFGPELENINFSTHVKWITDYKNNETHCIGHILIVDEVHKFNNLNGIRSHYLRFASKDAFRILLLSATPIGNNYDELTGYLMMLSGHNYMGISGENLILTHFKINPDDEEEENEKTKKIKTGLTKKDYDKFKKELVQQINNIDNFDKPVLGELNKPNDLKCNFSFFNTSSSDYPRKKEHLVFLKMSENYQREYNIIESVSISYDMYKYIMYDLNVSKFFPERALKNFETKQQNRKDEYVSWEDLYELMQYSETGSYEFDSNIYTPSFLHNIRISSMSIQGESPKIKWTINHIKKRFKRKEKVLLYTNWISEAVKKIENELYNIPNIKFASITGSITKTQRSKIIKDFNEDKIDVMLISSAGAEGLDLKKTRSIVIIEPHWNRARIDQIIGRGVRYKSHEGLPEKDKLVDVYHLLIEKDYEYQNKMKAGRMEILKTITDNNNKNRFFKKKKQTKKETGLRLTADILLFYLSLTKNIKVNILNKLINYFSIENNPNCFKRNKTKY